MLYICKACGFYTECQRIALLHARIVHRGEDCAVPPRQMCSSGREALECLWSTLVEMPMITDFVEGIFS
jgi:hypothetical protein